MDSEKKRSPTGGYDDENISYRRSGLDDPFFYNNYDRRPVLVRDVRTGRTFYVYPNASSSLFDPYASDNRYYDNRNYNDRRYYNNRPRYNQNTKRNPVVSDQQKKEQREKLEESRRRILGKKN